MSHSSVPDLELIKAEEAGLLNHSSSNERNHIPLWVKIDVHISSMRRQQLLLVRMDRGVDARHEGVEVHAASGKERNITI